MKIVEKLKKSRLAGFCKTIPIYKDRLRICMYRGRVVGWTNKNLFPGYLWIDKVDVVVTTACNLMCEGCSHLMPYYAKPQFRKAYHMDKERVIASLRKLNEAVDSFNHYNFLGGEPFLNPDLKFFIEEVPVEKCHLVQVLTNGTIVPDDPELFDVLRRKKVQVVVSQYPSNQESQKRLIEVLEREHVGWHSYSPPWFDYGEPRDYHCSERELRRQFIRCPECCHNLLDGKLYYCMRGSHTADLGICTARPGDAVDLLNNTRAQNKRQIRRLIWRLKPIEACRYCLRGTEESVEISRGK